MSSQKLPIQRNPNSLIGRLHCPKTGRSQYDTLCEHCAHCRIMLYDHVKCSYESDMEKRNKSYFTSL